MYVEGSKRIACKQIGAVASVTNSNDRSVSPSSFKRIIIIVGGYGSGKSEVSVNLARHLASGGTAPISIADLDIVNPYFRSREAASELEAFGVKCLIPAGGQVFADLPIIIPEIKGAIGRNDGFLILDVGGDDVGARVLSSLADAFSPDGYDMLLVLNARRPFTSDMEGAIRMLKEIEAASRLKFTGIISNTHLMEDTTEQTVLEGLSLAHEVSARSGLPIQFLSAAREISRRLDGRKIDVPLFPLDRALVKPWEHKGRTWTDKRLRIH